MTTINPAERQLTQAHAQYEGIGGGKFLAAMAGDGFAVHSPVRTAHARIAPALRSEAPGTVQARAAYAPNGSLGFRS
jgi:hypothetical protein